MFSSNDLVLIRHAAADTAGRLCGRRDVGLAEGTATDLSKLAKLLPEVAEVRVSPALRCRLTASALWPGAAQVADERLWEQDFGAWDGKSYAELPDLGDLSREDLAAHTPPAGESFLDLLDRATPALVEAAEAARKAGPVVIVAHAGIARAGLSLALGAPSVGLGFEVDPLSLTRIGCFEAGYSVRAVNWRPA